MKIKPDPFFVSIAVKHKKETKEERIVRLAAEQITRNKARNKRKKSER